MTGTVTTASGALVPNARVDLFGGSLSRATNTDTGGTFSLPDVPEGTFTVRATNPATGLPVSTTVVVARDQTSSANLSFPPVGRLDLQVNFARGAAAANATIQLQEEIRGTGFRFIGSTDGSGHLAVNGVSAGAFVVQAQHPDNQRITALAAGTVADDGSVVPVTMTLPVAATVIGAVTDESGSVVTGIGVTIRSTNPVSGGFQSTSTDSNGAYAIAGVPEGAFTVTVQDFGRQLFGETSGAVIADGQDVTANLSLINNAVSLPTIRYDANQSNYYIGTNGSVTDQTRYAFGYYWDPSYGAGQLEIVSSGVATSFTGANVGTMEQNGREIVARQSNVAGLDVRRKVFVPADGLFRPLPRAVHEPDQRADHRCRARAQHAPRQLLRAAIDRHDVHRGCHAQRGERDEPRSMGHL